MDLRAVARGLNFKTLCILQNVCKEFKEEWKRVWDNCNKCYFCSASFDNHDRFLSHEQFYHIHCFDFSDKPRGIWLMTPDEWKYGSFHWKRTSHMVFQFQLIKNE